MKFVLLMILAATSSCLSTAKNLGINDDVDDLIVQTTRGPVKGKTALSGHGKEVDLFLGIPYAKPPVGNYRFRTPEPMDPWQEVFDATNLPNSCIQINDTKFGDFRGSTMWNANTRMSEDCLKLNIWVPKPRPDGSAVLVWIHGGGFWSGTSALDVYDAKILSTEEQIIVVSLNYRVASLGFLFFDRPDVPGNVGLLDQALALQWIRDNIAHFGGDPDKVTIFGESAGASSVGFHLLSPVSRNLFNRAILQSGSPVSPWSILDTEESIRRGLKLAENLNCPNDSSSMDQVVDCLRSKDPFQMVTLEWDTWDKGIIEFPFSPVVDGTFLTEKPQKSLATRNVKDADILMGSNTDEGNFFLVYFLSEHFKKEEDIHIDRQTFIDIVRDLYPTVGKLGQDSITFLYTDWEKRENTFSYHDAVDKMIGDLHFICPVNDLALRYSEFGNDVYMYYFKHRSSVHPWPKWMGVLHADEINFVFGEPLNTDFGYTEEETELSKQMMRYWSNFAKTGNPNLPANEENDSITWPLHTTSGREYFTLAVNSTSIGKARRAQQCAFWKDYLPEVVQETRNTGFDSCHQPQTSGAPRNLFWGGFSIF